MSHVVLLGDSIFDNAAYVNSGPAVIDQLRGKLPSGWRASLLAVDGHITMNVLAQLEKLSADATHLVVSVGGNDALSISPIFSDAASSVAEVFDRFAIIQNNFRRDYAAMLARVLSHNKPATVCTIYDAIPGLDPPRVTALSLFNDVIFREAFRTRIPVIDLRLICTQAADYADISPIEPSVQGGDKITTAIVEVLTRHDFSAGQRVVYA
jgi:hypothetical protein